jgi:flagellar basal-body rod protein FlgB
MENRLNPSRRQAFRLASVTSSGFTSRVTSAPASQGVSTTHAGHIGGGTGGAGRIDSTVQKYRATEQPSLDANNVDLDRERANFADNAVRYEAGLRFINGSVRTLLSAIRGE